MTQIVKPEKKIYGTKLYSTHMLSESGRSKNVMVFFKSIIW